ncbi:MAG TPA: DUF3365 domain-containing protein [Lamprocystis sp. (in: g-proteobacteria)]|nr:DUF3365 domain-containing protein [Lamprocystis sp. (in: g-proteobacteria)]
MRQSLMLTATVLLAAGAFAAEPPVAPVVPSATPATPTAAPLPAPNPNLDQAKVLMKEFAETLKGELEAAMKSGGPTAAVVVCKDRAPAIAAGVSARSGWEVGRVSLKPRNPKLDTPDAWEKAVLTRFDERKATGEAVDTMAFAEVVQGEQGKQFRFMKAIPTGEVCLACHGSAITPEVAAALDQAYPGDPARGYALGDVRGAFSLAKPIN